MYIIEHEFLHGNALPSNIYDVHGRFVLHSSWSQKGVSKLIINCAENNNGVYMKTKQILLSLLAVLVFLMPTLSLAQGGYQYVVGGVYSSSESDSNIDTTTLLGALQIYTSPINYMDGPYAEAGFLNRQSNLLLSFGTIEFEADLGVTTASLDGTNLGFGFEYGNQSTPFTIGVLYNQAKADDTVLNANLELNYDVLGLQLGYYLTNKSRLRFEYAQTEIELLGNGFTIVKSEADSYGLTFRNLSYLARGHFAGFTVGAVYIDNDADEQNTELSLAADYYWARTTSLGAGVVFNSGDDVAAEGTTLRFNASIFVSPMASIGFWYEQFSADEENNDEDTIRLDFAIRF